MPTQGTSNSDAIPSQPMPQRHPGEVCVAPAPSDFYDRRAHGRPRELRREYHRLVLQYFQRIIPPKARVLEVGCGLGDLLAGLKPSVGVGIDCSPEMVRLASQRHPELTFQIGSAETFSSDGTFDYIVLADLANDLWDVQAVLDRLRSFAHPRTRLVLNFFNHLWLPVLKWSESLGWKAQTPVQNWLSCPDVVNLLGLAGWELVSMEDRILWPIRTPILGDFLNRWLAPLLRPLCLSHFCAARVLPAGGDNKPHLLCSVIVPTRNEAGTIHELARRVPEMGKGTEILFVEGGSQDATWDEIQSAIRMHPERSIRAFRQPGRGKADAVRHGIAQARGDVVMILDGDLTVAPEELPKFYEAIRSGIGEFVNGVRLVYPREQESMRFLNMIANKFFSLAWSWMLGRPVKDTLCGTKAFRRDDFQRMQALDFATASRDPFGDFDLLLGAARLGLRAVELPVRYRARRYGSTNILRWRHGWMLLTLLVDGLRQTRFPKTTAWHPRRMEEFQTL